MIIYIFISDPTALTQDQHEHYLVDNRDRLIENHTDVTYNKIRIRPLQ